MNIIKIGGVLLSDSDNLLKLNKLINTFDKPVFLIISAIGKTTRILQEICYLAYEGNYSLAVDKLEQIKKIHLNIINNIFPNQNDVHKEIYKIFIQIDKYLQGIFIVRELNQKILDKILSNGEKLSALIVQYFLKSQNIAVNYLKAEDYIVTDDNFGNAHPLFHETKEQFSKLAIRPEIYLIEGFYGKNKKNEITTMGFESSNLTATLVASILNIRTIHIISDVDCIFTADPKIIPNALPISQIDTSTARLLAKVGVKLIYDGMIEYIEQTESQLIYSSLNNSRKTLISKNIISDNLPILSFGDSKKLKIKTINLSSKDYEFYIALVNIDYSVLLKVQNFFIENLVNFSLNYNYHQKLAIFFINNVLSNELMCEIHNLIISD